MTGPTDRLGQNFANRCHALEEELRDAEVWSRTLERLLPHLPVSDPGDVRG